MANPPATATTGVTSVNNAHLGSLSDVHSGADRPLPAVPLIRRGERDSTWFPALLGVLDELLLVDSAWACVTRPSPVPAARRDATEALEARLRSASASAAGRLSIVDGEEWTVRVSRMRCTPADSVGR